MCVLLKSRIIMANTMTTTYSETWTQMIKFESIACFFEFYLNRYEKILSCIQNYVFVIMLICRRRTNWGLNHISVRGFARNLKTFDGDLKCVSCMRIWRWARAFTNGRLWRQYGCRQLHSLRCVGKIYELKDDEKEIANMKDCCN